MSGFLGETVTKLLPCNTRIQQRNLGVPLSFGGDLGQDGMFLGTQFPQLHKGKGGTTEPLILGLSMRNGTRAGHQPHPPAETQMSSVGVQPPQCFRLRKGTFPASFIEDLNHILTPTASPPGAKMWEEIAAFVPAADAARNGFPRILFPNPNNKNAHSLY